MSFLTVRTDFLIRWRYLVSGGIGTQRRLYELYSANHTKAQGLSCPTNFVAMGKLLNISGPEFYHQLKGKGWFTIVLSS